MIRMKNRSTLSLQLLLALICCASFAQAQLIVNGDMELWTGNCPLNTPPDGWTNYSTQLIGPDQAGTCAGTVTSHSGSSHMNLCWIFTGTQEGAIQTLNNLPMGITCHVEFWAINNNGLYADPGDCRVEVHRNSTPIYSTQNLVAGGAWTYHTVDFVVNSPIEPIGIRVVAGTAGTSGSAGVDDFSVTQLVNVGEPGKNVLKVYPVPTTDALFIDLGDGLVQNLGDVPFVVRNVVGQTLEKGQVSFAGGKARLDLEHLQAGVYFLDLLVEGEQVVRKFVKN
jgi:hypothetical protein